jgi:hypothetical protein
MKYANKKLISLCLFSNCMYNDQNPTKSTLNVISGSMEEDSVMSLRKQLNNWTYLSIIWSECCNNQVSGPANFSPPELSHSNFEHICQYTIKHNKLKVFLSHQMCQYGMCSNVSKTASASTTRDWYDEGSMRLFVIYMHTVSSWSPVSWANAHMCISLYTENLHYPSDQSLTMEVETIYKISEFIPLIQLITWDLNAFNCCEAFPPYIITKKFDQKIHTLNIKAIRTESVTEVVRCWSTKYCAMPGYTSTEIYNKFM